MSDVEIDEMDIDALLHIEHDLRKQNSAVDKHVSSLNGKLEKLRFKQNELEKRNRNANVAKNWETRQKEAHIKELNRAKAELLAKKQQVMHLAKNAEKLRSQITELEEKLKSINEEKRNLDDKYMHPSFRDTVMFESELMGPITQHIVNKTVENILPGLEKGLQEIEEVHRKLEKSSTTTTIFTSLCIYGLSLGLLSFSYKCAKTIYRMITMARTLFTIDMLFMLMWLMVCICYGMILRDPLQALAQKHGGLSVVVQIAVIVVVIGNVLLRCLLVSSTFSQSAYGELICVVFVAQHYYQTVWVPLMMDEEVKASFWSYMSYSTVSAWLAIYRARKQAGKLEEEVDSAMSTTWLKEKVGLAIQYCEKMLTYGVKGCADDDEEGLEDRDSSWQEYSIRSY